MGYEMKNGRYARTRSVTVVTAAVTTATGAVANSVQELGDQNTARLTLNATAVSGTTPSVTVTVETSADGSTGWTSVGAFAAVTAVSSQRKVFTGLDRFIRLNATAVTGTTPSVTYTVSGETA